MIVQGKACKLFLKIP